MSAKQQTTSYESPTPARQDEPGGAGATRHAVGLVLAGPRQHLIQAAIRAGLAPDTSKMCSYDRGVQERADSLEGAVVGCRQLWLAPGHMHQAR